jgi:carbon-monoxide dehydrogenase small subunit
MKSCLILAVETLHDEITTIEGIDNPALQTAFVACQGFQCGCCTAGMIVNADSLLKQIPKPTPDQTRRYMESNLCRCTGYEGIEAAITHMEDRQSPKG